MELSDIAGTVNLGDAVAMSVGGGVRVPKDWADAGQCDRGQRQSRRERRTRCSRRGGGMERNRRPVSPWRK